MVPAVLVESPYQARQVTTNERESTSRPGQIAAPLPPIFFSLYFIYFLETQNEGPIGAMVGFPDYLKYIRLDLGLPQRTLTASAMQYGPAGGRKLPAMYPGRSLSCL